MSTVSKSEVNAAASNYDVASAQATQKKSKVTGKTIGKPELSEKAAKYYEELKKKYSKMDFILVSEDMKEQAKAQAGSYANANSMVVLIDEEKLEKMAEDENYRKKYEGIIGNAASNLSSLKDSMGAVGANVKAYGVQINDNGTASYFAVIDKSLSAQKDRIEKKAAEKKAAQKAEDKKKAKEAYEEKLKEKSGKTSKAEGDDTVTITASSVEELMQKLEDWQMEDRSDHVLTQTEMLIGQRFDFKG